MITLTKQQIQTITQLLQPANNVPPEMPSRLNAALAANHDPVEVELNEESAEVVLDNLPMPDKAEHPVYTQLRTAFSQFLANLRNPNQK